MPLLKQLSQPIYILLIICVCASIGDFTDADHLDEDTQPTSGKIFNKTLRWTTNEFLQQSLDKANELRKKHNAPPMTIDKILSWEAEEYARKVGQHCEELGEAKPFYSHKKWTGENVWVSDKETTVTGDVPVQFWYDEVAKHDFKNNVFNVMTAQFTQLIWKSSRVFGVGMAKSPVKNYLVVVARFKPNGNFKYNTSFDKNVAPAA